MKRLKLTPYAALLVLAAFLSACSGPAENSGSSNANAQPQQANANSAAQPQIAQGNTAPPNQATPAVQPVPLSPAAKAAGERNANAVNTAKAPKAANARAPKLIAPDKKINYGKQPQEKSLVRAIIIKNGGLADLNIESVVPS